MDLDENDETVNKGENRVVSDQNDLFPEKKGQEPEELDLEFLAPQETQIDIPQPVPEPLTPSGFSPPQRSPLSPPRTRSQSRRTPAGYYTPNDYYLGTDWPRVIVGGLVALLILGGVVLLAVYLFNKFDEQNEPSIVVPSQIEEVTSVKVYSCAGDAIPINEIEPPSQAFLEGKNASGTWIAFRDPSSPLNQLWARADDLPILDFGSLTILNCVSSQSSSDEDSPLSLDTNPSASEKD